MLDYTYVMRKTKSGFTIVELSIVIVIIAILATITIVAYNGVQQRGRDTQRKQDIANIRKALELYYDDNGRYPLGSCTSACKINGSWSTTSDGSWANLATALVPNYIDKLPSDPRASTATQAAIYGGLNYDYVAPGGWCGTNSGQMYLLAYRLESEPQKYDITGNCPGTQPTNYGSSEAIQTRQ